MHIQNREKKNEETETEMLLLLLLSKKEISRSFMGLSSCVSCLSRNIGISKGRKLNYADWLFFCRCGKLKKVVKL